MPEIKVIEKETKSKIKSKLPGLNEIAFQNYNITFIVRFLVMWKRKMAKATPRPPMTAMRTL